MLLIPHADAQNSDLATLTRFGASNNCTMPCSGDASARCGGDFRADMYTITDPLPAGIPVTNSTYIGCYL